MILMCCKKKNTLVAKSSDKTFSSVSFFVTFIILTLAFAIVVFLILL